MMIKYQPEGINDFHNSGPINLRLSGETSDGMFLVTGNQKKRIEKHFCGVKGCRCPGGALIQLNQDGTEFGIYKKWCQEVE